MVKNTDLGVKYTKVSEPAQLHVWMNVVKLLNLSFLIPKMETTTAFIFQFFGFFYYLLATPHSMWNLSSLTRDGIRAPCTGSAES